MTIEEFVSTYGFGHSTVLASHLDAITSHPPAEYTVTRADPAAPEALYGPDGCEQRANQQVRGASLPEFEHALVQALDAREPELSPASRRLERN